MTLTAEGTRAGDRRPCVGEVAITAAAVDAVRVGPRHRVDLGDVEALAASIDAVGLLHPVVVTADLGLVAGARRLAAVRLLGWDQVPVHVVSGLGDAAALLAAERDENTCRKDMTPEEKVALGRALEDLERPKARRRQREAIRERDEQGRAVATPEKFPEAATRGEVRDLVGAAVGMSGVTYQRAKAVVSMAREGRTPDGEQLTEQEQVVALEALEEMNATGKVTPAYTKARPEPPLSPPLAEAHPAEPQPAEPEPAEPPRPVSAPPRAPRRGVDNAVEGVVHRLSGLCHALAGIPPDYRFPGPQAAEWARSLRRDLRVLGRLARQLEGR